MFVSALFTLAVASTAAAAALEQRGTCTGFDDHCGPWNMTIDGHDWHMSMYCKDSKGTDVYNKIDLNECIGNAWGQLVSGGNFGYSCLSNVEPAPKPHLRNPLTVKCYDGTHAEPVASYIELHNIMCANGDGQLRCQNQIDQHLHGL